LLCTGLAVYADGLHFSSQPTVSEISSARIFDEPLLPIGGEPTAEENRAMANTLARYAGRASVDDFSSLTGFLARYPQSAWNGSLLLHLGVEYYNFGYYSKALDTWEQAWKQVEHINDPRGKRQADRALGELARMYSKLGRMNELQSLLDATKDRPLSGPATQLIHAANQALWMMQYRPEVSFRCGPLALDSILSHYNPTKESKLVIEQSKSSNHGYSLAQLPRLSWDAGLNYQAIYRSRNAPIPVPSVVHWKVGHYAALVRRDGDRIFVQDNTFRNSLWMTATAVNEEASGYFLVPPGPMPAGWRPVSDQEAQGVWGKGTVSSQATGATSKYDLTSGGSCANSAGMTTYTMHTMLVDLTLNDTPVGYTPPVGPPVRFTATYNQFEANQPATFYYSNLGQKWTCNWLSYITDNPQSTNAGISVSYYVDGGGTLDFTDFNPSNQTFAVEIMSHALLVMTSSSSYEMRFPDGSKREFAQSDGSTGTVRRVFLTEVIDPAGNPVQLNYDSQFRITNIVDAIGQSTTLQYTNATLPYAITSVTDPFGRTAIFQYNSSGMSSGMLSQITDVLGLTSQYDYGAGDFVSSLVTPYGTTVFATGGSTNSGSQWIQATDPLGETEYLEDNENTPIAMTDPTATVPIGMGALDNYLIWRNSIYWDKKACADGFGDVTKARIYHFLHLSSNTSVESPILDSVKEPLENRVWYTYLNQPAGNITGSNSLPSFVGRVLDDGTTQLSGFLYNPVGNVTNATDPVGRNFTYIYSTNNVDLQEVHMTHNGQDELQSRFTYNSQHLPLTITDASGQTTTNTYNGQGQILSTTDPLGEVTTFSYATNGYLLSITGPLQNTNDVTRFTYDGFGRVRTVTDTQGYTLTYAYDAMDRKTKITYPDGTFDQFSYNLLDLVSYCDRMGRCTTNTYNADRQLVQTVDPLSRTNSFNWCKCGALTSLTDPMGRTTQWRYDVQSRPVAKIYPDGSTIQYTYENTTSRLQSKYDEKGQQTSYEYYGDNNLKSISYQNAAVTTPTVTYTYDPDYNRVLTMQDGVGTTTYSYNPITTPPVLGAGKLVSVTGPLLNSAVTYHYDAVGRVVTRTINGVPQSTTYDLLGRPVAVTNALGAFQYSYVGATARLASEAYPNGQTNLYTYYGNLGDERLQQIQHLKPNGSLLSAFGYGYNPVGEITTWSNQWDTIPTRVWSPAYDAADQLTNVVSIGGPSTVTNYAYAYDPAGNRLLAATNGVANNYTYNALNQIVGSTSGPTNAPTYTWDAANRLTAINQGVNSSLFSYDGTGRRVEDIELTNGVPVSTNYFLWCGTRICEVRDGTGAITLRRLYAQGEQLVTGTGTNCFYTRDGLGSIREALNSSGVLATRYDYDPFGQQTTIQQNLQTTFAYGGYFVHTASGLYLTLYRPLDSGGGRWLSRDPMGESFGINLYGYVGQNPVSRVDPLGLWFGVDDLVFTVGGAIIGVAGTAISDYATGQPITWQGLASGAAGGAVSGEVTLYAGPVVGGLAGAAVGNGLNQALNIWTGKQCQFNTTSFVEQTALGGLTGFIPDLSDIGIEIPGINAGEGNDSQIFDQIVAKASNGEIGNITFQTATKMFIGNTVNGLSGTAYGIITGALVH
jgi:RHS repeat-associated protein